MLLGCNDIFEKRISNDEVLLLIPNNADTLSSNEVHFKWEELTGASEYELNIVSPTFENIQEFVLDSAVKGDEFKILLSPGEYEFKMRGINSTYQSKFTPVVSFFVDSISDLSMQKVQLISPEAIYYTNQSKLNVFSWQTLFLADYYIFQIWNSQTFGNGSLLFQQNNIYGVNFDFYETTNISLEEGFYVWGIKAVNDISESIYGTRSIFIDTTAPNNPDITYPINNFLSPSNQLTLKWTKNGPDQGNVQSPVYSNIQISFNDSLFSSSNLIEINNISNDSLQRQFPISGNYWWRVYLSDKAGNESKYYSLSEKFIIP